MYFIHGPAVFSILGLELHQEEEPHFRLFKHVLMQDVGEWVYTNEKEMIASLRADIRSICHKEKKGKRYFCEKDELLGPSFAYSLPVHSLHTRRDRVASLKTCRLQFPPCARTSHAQGSSGAV